MRRSYIGVLINIRKKYEILLFWPRFIEIHQFMRIHHIHTWKVKTIAYVNASLNVFLIPYL